MASGWDAHSDVDSRFDFEGQDSALWRHLPRLVDGVNKLAISDATQLVALYQYHSIEPEVDNTLLRNLTGISDPSVPCQLVLGSEQDQHRLPPKVGTDEHSYDLGLSFNKLVSYRTTRASRDVLIAMSFSFWPPPSISSAPSCEYSRKGDRIPPYLSGTSIATAVPVRLLIFQGSWEGRQLS